MEYYQTGDILLFNGKGWLSYFIEYFGKCDYSHIGMVVVNPSTELKGVYLLDCSLEDNKAVQLRLLDDVIKDYDGSVYFRKMIYERSEKFQTSIMNVYNEVKDVPYDLDIFDWIAAKILVDTDDLCRAEKTPFSNIKDTSKFWCSALVAYLYVRSDILPISTPWSIIAPVDFTSYPKYFLEFKCKFEVEKKIK